MLEWDHASLVLRRHHHPPHATLISLHECQEYIGCRCIHPSRSHYTHGLVFSVEAYCLLCKGLVIGSHLGRHVNPKLTGELYFGYKDYFKIGKLGASISPTPKGVKKMIGTHKHLD